MLYMKSPTTVIVYNRDGDPFWVHHIPDIFASSSKSVSTSYLLAWSWAVLPRYRFNQPIISKHDHRLETFSTFIFRFSITACCYLLNVDQAQWVPHQPTQFGHPTNTSRSGINSWYIFEWCCDGVSTFGAKTGLIEGFLKSGTTQEYGSGYPRLQIHSGYPQQIGRKTRASSHLFRK